VKGYFKKSPNSFRQLPSENLMIPKALLKPIVFKALKCDDNETFEKGGFFKGLDNNKIAAGRNL
jgi:hypothetical protein